MNKPFSMGAIAAIGAPGAIVPVAREPRTRSLQGGRAAALDTFSRDGMDPASALNLQDRTEAATLGALTRSALSHQKFLTSMAIIRNI